MHGDRVAQTKPESLILPVSIVNENGKLVAKRPLFFNVMPSNTDTYYQLYYDGNKNHYLIVNSPGLIPSLPGGQNKVHVGILPETYKHISVALTDMRTKQNPGARDRANSDVIASVNRILSQLTAQQVKDIKKLLPDPEPAVRRRVNRL